MKYHPLQRVVATLGLLVVLACQGGCVRARPTITSLWERVPPVVRWPSRETLGDAQNQQPVAEPSVAANVALKKESEPESVSAVEARSRSLPNPFGSRINTPEPRSDEIPGRFDINDAWESGSAGTSTTESSNSPLDRLNAALTDEVQNALPERSLTILEERLRVDSLIAQALELLESGQLDRAREMAVAALELGEAAHLEYAPDEDRPMDLVRRIESQLDSRQATQETRPESDLSASTGSGQEADSSLATKHTQVQDKDGKASPKNQRAWSNLFRREKKPNTQTSDPATHTSNHPTPPQPPESSSPVTDARPSRQESRDAIVMANRSVSLEPTEQTFESTVSTVSAREQSYSDQVASTPRNEMTTEPQSVVAEEEAETPVTFLAEHDASTPDLDSSVPALPDLENIELSRPTSVLETTVGKPVDPEPTEEAEIDRESNSLFIYIVFGVCCVLAIACYRRGAT